MPEYRTFMVEASMDFTVEFRRLEHRIERQDALLKAHIRSGHAEKAAEAADRHSDAVDEQDDLLFEEMHRLWTNARQTGDKLPLLPEAWEPEAGGRCIRFSFYEIEAFRGL